MLCIIITIRIIFKNCTQTGVNNFIGMHFYYYFRIILKNTFKQAEQSYCYAFLF